MSFSRAAIRVALALLLALLALTSLRCLDPTALDVIVFSEVPCSAHARASLVGGTSTSELPGRPAATRAGAGFGDGASIDGDTIIVGAAGDSSSATGVNGNQSDTSAWAAGAAYVFTRNAGVWSQQAYLKASNTRTNANFGYVSAIVGDTAVVTAYFESGGATGVNGNQLDTSAMNSGAAYVFTRSAGVWTQQAYLKASNTAANAAFGYGLAIANDTLVVGAPGESSNATGVGGNQSDSSAVGAGAAYVFTRTAGTWTQQAYLKASNTRANASFSVNLALAGDHLVVGSTLESSNAQGINGNQSDTSIPGEGAAYTFARVAGVWAQGAYLKASNTPGGYDFGVGTGVTSAMVAVGAIDDSSGAKGIGGDQNDTSSPGSGAVYVY